MVQKETTLNVTINADYAKKINRVLENKQDETPDFEAQGMKGKERSFADCKSIVENARGNKMLYCFKEHNTKSMTTYFHNDIVITKEKGIKLNLFTPSFLKPKESSVGRGAVDQENDFAVFTVRH